MKEEYSVWSDYEAVKQEIMYQHSITIDSFNEYRMQISLGRPERARVPYLTAGKSLNKLRHWCVMSGAWDEEEELERISKIISHWMNNGRKPVEVIQTMDDMQILFEKWFIKTRFYDIKIMNNDPSKAVLGDKSY